MTKQEFIKELKIRLKDNPDGVKCKFIEDDFESDIVDVVYITNEEFCGIDEAGRLIVSQLDYYEKGKFIEPERETFTLYESVSVTGLLVLVNKNGSQPDFHDKNWISDSYSKIAKANINKNKQYKFYADTWKRVVE